VDQFDDIGSLKVARKINTSPCTEFTVPDVTVIGVVLLYFKLQFFKSVFTFAAALQAEKVLCCSASMCVYPLSHDCMLH